MTKTVTAISDRLLGLLVPRVAAQAEPCGPLVSHFCGCYAGKQRRKLCCTYSGACYPCEVVSGC
jgi:hypothetical protein